MVNGEVRQRELLGDLQDYRDRVYSRPYNPRLPEYWRRLRAAAPDSRFVVFTTPISEPMFALAMADGRYDDYARWLTELVEAFGAVWDFMGVNSVTTDLARYRDAQHFDEHVGRLITDRLMGRPLPPKHEDFGRLVTSSNLDEHLASVRALLPGLDPDPVASITARLAGRGGAVGEGRAAKPERSAISDAADGGKG